MSWRSSSTWGEFGYRHFETVRALESLFESGVRWHADEGEEAAAVRATLIKLRNDPFIEILKLLTAKDYCSPDVLAEIARTPAMRRRMKEVGFIPPDADVSGRPRRDPPTRWREVISKCGSNFRSRWQSPTASLAMPPLPKTLTPPTSRTPRSARRPLPLGSPPRPHLRGLPPPLPRLRRRHAHPRLHHRRRTRRRHPHTPRLPSTAPPLSPARGPPQHDLAFDADPGFDLDQTPAYDLSEPEPVPDFDFNQDTGA